MFLELRKKLINWLISDSIIVLANVTIYDTVLEANSQLFPNNCVFRGIKTTKLEPVIEFEVQQRIRLADQGIHKQSEAFVLDPFYKKKLLS